MRTTRPTTGGTSDNAAPTTIFIDGKEHQIQFFASRTPAPAASHSFSLSSSPALLGKRESLISESLLEAHYGSESPVSTATTVHHMSPISLRTEVASSASSSPLIAASNRHLNYDRNNEIKEKEQQLPPAIMARKKKIAIIGAGWYGCHIARALQLAGYEVTLFESHDDIFKGISGEFGIRLHTGPHYPRSKETRRSCREGYTEFIETYPDLIIPHEYSIYGLGTLDANNEPSKVDLETFKTVCKEVREIEDSREINSKNNLQTREIDPKKWGYDNLLSAFDANEPSIALGKLLREEFRKYLSDAGVKVVCNYKVNQLTPQDSKVNVIGESSSEVFDHVVNTTSYQSLLPAEQPLPLNINIFYQPCLALVYEDTLSKTLSTPPFSFIVVDGMYPCIMPRITEAEETGNRTYIVTHGKYTIMGSYKTRKEAQACLDKINEDFIKKHIQPKCEAEMQKFWPPFGALRPDSTERRFKYVGFKSAILGKIKSNTEFRSAVTFGKDGITYVIPGKVSNIFDAERETLALINSQNLVHQPQGAYQYVKNGTLDQANKELTEAMAPGIKNTCDLQTYDEIIKPNISISEHKQSTDSVSIPNAPKSKLKRSTSTPLLWATSKTQEHESRLKRSNSASFFQLPKTPQSQAETISLSKTAKKGITA